ncbi:MAG: alpha/beta hydrolase, partial [Candidatus Methylomirabilis sp.]|nr:alpha/beta hydrolase [Deltaproteobacteria bacterium]
MAIPQIARYTAIGPSLWSFEKLPAGTREENLVFKAADGGESSGVLYTRGGEKTVVVFMHPRGNMKRHYPMPWFLEAGYATFGQEGRWPGNDVACIHEMLLADIAASMKVLRERFAHVVFFGNSGGGALYSFYQAQAATPAGERLTATPAGDPYDLNKLDLPQGDAIFQVATHLGEGMLLQNCIDPSVADESDPLSCDPALDMYNPANGYRELPQPSKYSEEFLARYREGQRARVARLDAIARGFIADQRHHLAQMLGDDYDKLPLEKKQYIHRRAFTGRYMVIHRTEAHPAYCDPSIHPSTRDIGSFFPVRPDIFNYMEPGFAKYLTPRGWLSTWSGISSKANVMQCLPRLT